MTKFIILHMLELKQSGVIGGVDQLVKGSPMLFRVDDINSVKPGGNARDDGGEHGVVDFIEAEGPIGTYESAAEIGEALQGSEFVTVCRYTRMQ